MSELRPLESWKRRMLAVGVLLVLLGSVAMVGGGLQAGRAQYVAGGDDGTIGLWVGTVGTLAVVTGIVVAKLGLVGPYPKHLAHLAPPVGPEVED